MKIDNYRKPKSAFLSVEKDLNQLVTLFLKNNNFKKLLYYTTPDALSQPVLTEEQSIGLLDKNIKILPKLYIDNSVLNYIVITFDNYVTNASNPEFRDNTITFDIICHFDQWNLGDFKLRPYRIAAEIDSMLDNVKFSGIGLLEFFSCNQLILNDEYAGLVLTYHAIHGEDDKKNAPNPIDEQALINNFNAIYNYHQ